MNLFVLTSFFLLLLNGRSSSLPTRLTILHSNDIHGNYAGDDDGYGGIPKLIHMIKKFKSTSSPGNPVIYLNAGDLFTGTVWFTIHRTNIAADVVKLLKPDALTLGNHEFDEGIRGLNSFLANINQPVLCANGIFKEEQTISPYMQPSVTLKVFGHEIGIIGYINSETGLIADTGKIRFINDIEAVKREAAKMRAKGVKIIIGLGHSGFVTDKKLAEVVPDIDAVVGGHSHSLMYTGQVPTKDPKIGDYPQVITKPNGVKVPVVQVGYAGRYMGKLVLTFDEDGNLLKFDGEAILLGDQVAQDEEALEMLSFYRPAVESLQRQVVGSSKVFLQGGQGCRRAECNLGNLMTDSFCQYKADMFDSQDSWTDTPIALINGGALRNSINASKRSGNITEADIVGCLPFGNELVSLNLPTEALIEMLEFSVKSEGETSFGEFLQMSGLKVVFNMSQPPFSRVTSVQIRCGDCDVPTFSPVNLWPANKLHRLITTSYLADGGDGYKVFKETGTNLVKENSTDRDVLTDYIKNLRTVYTNLDNRVSMSLPIPSHRTVGFDGSGGYIKVTNELIVLGFIFVYFLMN